MSPLSAKILKRPAIEICVRNADRHLSSFRHLSSKSSHAHNNSNPILGSSTLSNSVPFTRQEDKRETHNPSLRGQFRSYTTSNIRSLPVGQMEPTMIHGRVRTREYSVTARSESATLALGLGAIAATAKAGQYAVTAYREWEKNQPEEPVDDGKVNAGDDAEAGASSSGSASGSASDASKGERKNMFSDFFSVGSKYYEGGFEEKMTLREAALILGVRESSTEKRIKEAHRKLLILNHPDTGGSTYLSGKLNEAKDLLLKSKGR